MWKFITIFCAFVLFMSTLADSLAEDDFVTETVELSERTNGTTTTITVSPSQKVFLQCSRQGYKNIKVGWFLEGRRLATEDKEGPYVTTSSLRVKNFKSESSKLIYSCRTEDSPVNLCSNVEIIVEDEVGILQYSLELTEMSSSHHFELVVPAAKTAEVTCLFQDMNPPDIGWYLDGVRLQTQDSQTDFASYSKLRISSGMLNPTGKKYTCRTGKSSNNIFAAVEISSEDEGPILQYSLELTEMSSSQQLELVIPATKTVEVTCFFQDLNPPDIGWYLDGVRLQTQDSKTDFVGTSKLRISSGMLNSSNKQYICRTGESKRTVFAAVEISSESNNNNKDEVKSEKVQAQIFYRDLLMIAVTVLPAVIFCFLICVSGIYFKVIRNRQPKREFVVHNLARDSSILADETYFTLKKSQKPLIAPPLAEIPSVHTGIPAPSQSYYHLNIGYGGLKTSV